MLERKQWHWNEIKAHFCKLSVEMLLSCIFWGKKNPNQNKKQNQTTVYAKNVKKGEEEILLHK